MIGTDTASADSISFFDQPLPGVALVAFAQKSRTIACATEGLCANPAIPPAARTRLMKLIWSAACRPPPDSLHSITVITAMRRPTMSGVISIDVQPTRSDVPVTGSPFGIPKPSVTGRPPIIKTLPSGWRMAFPTQALPVLTRNRVVPSAPTASQHDRNTLLSFMAGLPACQRL